MSAGRTAAVVVLGILLTATLATGNVVFAAHATVLDPGFTTNTIEEEGGYDALASEFERGISASTNETENADASSIEELIGQENVFEDAVTPEYLQSQVEPNVERVYAYLHGNEDELNVSIDTEPLVESAASSAESAIQNATTAELLGVLEGDPLSDLPVEVSTVAMLDEGPDAYEQAQEDVRDELYEQVLDAAVEQAYREQSNDELLAMVIPDYDPNDYTESEKEQLVTDHEAEIKTALGTAIEEERGDELEETVDDERSALRDDLVGEDVTTGYPSLDGPANDLMAVTVEALTTDMDHATYQDRAASARADLASAAGEYTEDALTEAIAAGESPEASLGLEENEGIQNAVTAVLWFDRLAIVLPLLAVVIVGLVYYLTRSVGRTVGTVGWSMLWAGIPAFVGATIVANRVPAMLGAGAGENPIQPFVIALFQRTVGHLAAQSLWVGVVGGLLVASAIGMRFGLHERLLGERFLGERVETTEGEAVETKGDDDPLSDRGGDQTDSTDNGTPQHEDR